MSWWLGKANGLAEALTCGRHISGCSAAAGRVKDPQNDANPPVDGNEAFVQIRVDLDLPVGGSLRADESSSGRRVSQWEATGHIRTCCLPQ